MSNPDVVISLVDNASAIIPSLTVDTHLKIGACSLGTTNAIYSFTREEDVRAELGAGPLVEAGIDALKVAGGPVFLQKVNASVAGSSGSVTQSGGGPLMTVTGASVDDFQGIVRITKGGAVGTAEFQYSLDGGDTWGSTIVTATTYPVPGSGLSLGFPAGTYVLDETYTWTSSAPYYVADDLNAAFAALWVDPREWLFVHVIGKAATAADSASMVAVVQSQLDSAVATKYRYTEAIVEMADASDGDLGTAFSAVVAPRVMAAAGYCELLSGVSGRYYKRPAAWPVASRAAKVARAPRVGIATHLGRTRPDGRGGALQHIRPVGGLYRDEERTPGLDALRFTTLRTIVGKAGYFVTRPRMMAAAGSDFGFWHDRLVIDKACRIMRAKLLDYLNDDVEVTGAGTIDELAARRIEGDLFAALRDLMVSTENVVRASIMVDRANVMTSTHKLRGDVRLRKRSYLEDIDFSIGFEVPIQSAA